MNRSENHTKKLNSDRNRSQKQGYRSEKLSKRMIESLMGIRDPIYERHNHATAKGAMRVNKKEIAKILRDYH